MAMLNNQMVYIYICSNQLASRTNPQNGVGNAELNRPGLMLDTPVVRICLSVKIVKKLGATNLL